MDIKDTVFKLVTAVGVSGDERSAAEEAEKFLKEYGQTQIDHFGNLTAWIGGRDNSKPTVLLDAHIDEIGLIVTYITDDGFLKVAGCGGIDRRLLLAQEVVIFGKKTIPGVITSIPPHLEKDNKDAPEIDDIYIDTGFSGDECKEIVSPGDRVIFSSRPASLAGDRITSKALDDRCGAAAILLALEKLKGKPLPVNLAVQFTAQEETGERGAKISSFNIQPDYAIAVDVSFGLTSDESRSKCGVLGKGPMIGFAPSLSSQLSKLAVEIAKQKGIPYQLEVMSGETGTNADAISVSGKGAKALTISIPLKYMHTPVEVIDISDLESTAELIAGVVESVVMFK